MTAFPYRKVEGEGVATVTAFNPASATPIVSASERHPHWSAILSGLDAGDPNVWDLFDVKTGVMSRLTSVTDRVSYNGVDILWDGDPVHSVIANQIKRALEQGEQNYEALAKFWEKVESNPNDHSKEQAYTWLATHDFKITSDGDVVGYKGVAKTPSGKFTSISHGTAFVDGVKHVGAIPNEIGSVVTMPRSEVKHNPNVHCHTGLHVGDWSYASNFARGAVLEVHVNPRDIVSVPNDHSYRKVRTCKYTVVGVVTSEYSGGPVLKPQTVSATWSGDASYKV